MPIRYAEQEEQALKVNWFEMSIWNEEKKKRTFYSSWITDTEIRAENVKHLADCGRARRKIENGHNNVLKNRGYNLEHNFGHGKACASENFCVLNLRAFLFHSVLYLRDGVYRQLRERSGRRDTFYNALRYTFSGFLHENWSAFIAFIWGDEPDG